MNISVRSTIVALVVSLASLTALSQADAQSTTYQQLAHRIITSSVQVQPGEVVLITGGKHTIPVMEALAIEAQKAGGLVTITLNSDKVIRSQYMDVPEKYLSIEPRYNTEWLRHVDVLITLPPTSDVKALDSGVSARRLGLISKAQDFATPLVDRMNFRELDIFYPTVERADSYHVSRSKYLDMMWAAIEADYDKITARGTAIKRVFERGHRVHITSPAGTDVTFALAQRPVWLSAGTITRAMAKGRTFGYREVTLPDGAVQVAPLENSANGKVVVARALCRFKVISNISFTFTNGVAHDFQAQHGRQCFDELQRASGGPVNTIGWFAIGLNPAMKQFEENGAAYFPGNDAGGVNINIGENEWLGGGNKTTGGFTYPFNIKNATVTVDGVKIVDGGKLVTQSDPR